MIEYNKEQSLYKWAEARIKNATIFWKLELIDENYNVTFLNQRVNSTLG